MSEVHFLDLCAIDHEFIYMAAQLDELVSEKPNHSRMFTYRHQDRSWHMHDVQMHVISTAIKLNHANDPEDRRLIALSDEGEVDVFAKGDYVWRTEKIPESGVRLGSRGLMSHVRQIGQHLFACGHNGQVYVRLGPEKWRAIDSQIYKSINYTGNQNNLEGRIEHIMRSMANQLVLNCIDGDSERDLYVVGDSGYMAHFDGSKWQKIILPTDEHLQWVRCYGPDEIWTCGYNGTLLKGNIRDGFHDQSSIDDNETWWCLAKHNGNIYLSATSGLYKFETESRKITRVKSDLEPEHTDTYRVDEKGGALWSMGERDIVRLYKNKWERIHHIDNQKIE